MTSSHNSASTEANITMRPSTLVLVLDAAPLNASTFMVPVPLAILALAVPDGLVAFPLTGKGAEDAEALAVW